MCESRYQTHFVILTAIPYSRVDCWAIQAAMQMKRVFPLALLCAIIWASQLQERQNNEDATVSSTLIYQYNPITWVENLAVRPNGWLLTTTTTSPLLNQTDPVFGELYLVHDFSSAGNSIQGITEILPDLYAVDALTCNITSLTLHTRQRDHLARRSSTPR